MRAAAAPAPKGLGPLEKPETLAGRITADVVAKLGSLLTPETLRAALIGAIRERDLSIGIRLTEVYENVATTTATVGSRRAQLAGLTAPKGEG